MSPENLDRTIAPISEPGLTDVILALRKLTDDYLRTIQASVVTRTESDIETEESDIEDEYGLRPKVNEAPPPNIDYIALRTGVLERLIAILDQDEANVSAHDKIDEFYKYLDEDTGLLPDNTTGEPLDTNLNLLKVDKSKSALRFIGGLSLIALTLITAVVPGLIVMGIVYAITQRHVFDLFKTQSDMFEKNLGLMKPKQQTFFKKVDIADDQPGLTDINNSMKIN